MNTNRNREFFLNELRKQFGTTVFRRKELMKIVEANNFTNIGWFVNSDDYRVGHGKFQFQDTLSTKSSDVESSSSVPASIPSSALESEPAPIYNFVGETHKENLVPEIDRLFVKHGEFDLISTIISSRKFYPIFITGLSGNGKTFGVEQACAQNRRELYRVNITIETDEDDLLGGFRLVNDSTKWFDGPVIRAMRSGGVLLLDEVDLGSNKLLCLQPVLEGKGILLKKINQFVKPAPGFTIIATANTKGQGSETGKFVGTNILNEAFLERFCATFEQGYPEERVEKSILKKLFDSMDILDEHVEDFVTKLVAWAFGTRKTYETGATSDLISTRRLVHIVNAYGILGHPKTDDKKKIGNIRRQAIHLCIARFDDITKNSFMSFYEKLDPYLSDDIPTPLQETEVKSEPNDILDILKKEASNP
jgi:hypothetical protein